MRVNFDKGMTLNGLYVYSQYAQEILSGKKSIEIRRTLLPSFATRGQNLWLIESFCKERERKPSQVVAIVNFKGQKIYESEREFSLDRTRHLSSWQSPYLVGARQVCGWEFGNVIPVDPFPVPLWARKIQFSHAFSLSDAMTLAKRA